VGKTPITKQNERIKIEGKEQRCRRYRGEVREKEALANNVNSSLGEKTEDMALLIREKNKEGKRLDLERSGGLEAEILPSGTKKELVWPRRKGKRKKKQAIIAGGTDKTDTEEGGTERKSR